MLSGLQKLFLSLCCCSHLLLRTLHVAFYAVAQNSTGGASKVRVKLKGSCGLRSQGKEEAPKQEASEQKQKQEEKDVGSNCSKNTQGSQKEREEA